MLLFFDIILLSGRMMLLLSVKSIKDNRECLEEYFYLSSVEWGNSYKMDNFNEILNKRVSDVLNGVNDNIILVLGLFNDDKLLGFISLFKYDHNSDYTPWYATMYVKKEYRGNNYSKILNDALIDESKKLGYDKIYLKTELVNYYEKFGFKYIKNLNEKEKLYYIDLKV